MCRPSVGVEEFFRTEVSLARAGDVQVRRFRTWSTPSEPRAREVSGTRNAMAYPLTSSLRARGFCGSLRRAFAVVMLRGVGAANRQRTASKAAEVSRSRPARTVSFLVAEKGHAPTVIGGFLRDEKEGSYVLACCAGTVSVGRRWLAVVYQ